MDRGSVYSITLSLISANWWTDRWGTCRFSINFNISYLWNLQIFLNLSTSPQYTFTSIYIYLSVDIYFNSHSPQYTFASIYMCLSIYLPQYTSTSIHIYLSIYLPQYIFTSVYIYLNRSALILPETDGWKKCFDNNVTSTTIFGELRLLEISLYCTCICYKNCVATFVLKITKDFSVFLDFNYACNVTARRFQGQFHN